MQYVELKKWWKSYIGEKLYLEPSEISPITFEHKYCSELLATAIQNPRSEGRHFWNELNNNKLGIKTDEQQVSQYQIGNFPGVYKSVPISSKISKEIYYQHNKKSKTNINPESET